MKLTMLGTGHATVTECYNTCFVLHDCNKYFLVDGGGGNTLLHRLKMAGIDWKEIKEIFVTHKHMDHFMGIIWLIRMICQAMYQGSYQGEVNIYAHEEVIALIKDIAGKLILEKHTAFIGKQIHLIAVMDGEERTVNDCKVTFFDIHSTKDKQFGFCLEKNGKKLTCCGDEPYHFHEEKYVRGSEWLLHEAFCLYSEAEIFEPYEKHHSTVKEACEVAQKLAVPNLLLYHTEDKNIERRKELYLSEGKNYYTGNLFVPDDLETIDLTRHFAQCYDNQREQ